MTNRLAILFLLLGLVLAPNLNAQDPFGVGGPATPPAAEGDEETTDEQADDGESDPRILAIRRLQPTTPEEITRAARTVMQFGRPDEAKLYLQALSTGQLDPATLYRLNERFGSAFFMHLAQNEELQPEGRDFAMQVTAAVRQAHQNVERLVPLAVDTARATGNQKRLHFRELLKSGDSAVEAMVRVLADPNHADVHEGIATMLAAWGPSAEGALLGALDGGPEVRPAALKTLGRMRSEKAKLIIMATAVNPRVPEPERRSAQEAVKRQVGQLPKIDEVKALLEMRTQQFLDGSEITDRADHRGDVVAWLWDAETGSSRPVRIPLADATFMAASRLAGELMGLDPENPEFLRLFLITDLETEKRLRGFDQPVSTEAGTAGALALAGGPALLEDLLDLAMKKNLTGAAAASCQLMGETGDLSLLESDQGRAASLADALLSGDRRVRFEALTAILKLNPQKRFAGSSRVTQALGFFARSGGVSRALIGHPRVGLAQDLVGQLGPLGFEADTAHNARQLLRLIAENADLEFILISDNFNHPPLSELMQLIRKSEHGKRTPVAIISQTDELDRARRVAETDTYAIAVAKPFDANGLSRDVQNLLDLAGRDRVRRAERYQQAIFAITEIERLVSSDAHAFYDLYRLEDVALASLPLVGMTEAAASFLGT